MKYPAEDLALLISQFKEKLNPRTRFYYDFDIITTELWQHIGKPEEIPLLVRLHSFLSHKNNIETINQLDAKKLTEQINLTLLKEFEDNISRFFNHKKLKKQAKENDSPSFLKTWGFTLFTICGTIFAAVNGAAIMQSFVASLSLFTQVSNSVALPLQLTFGVLSVLVFLFELRTLGKALGIPTLEVGIVFKLYAKQSRQYKKTLSLIEEITLLKDIDAKELSYLNMAYNHLSTSYQEFQETINEAKNIKLKPSYCKKLFKNIFTGLVAIFCGTIAAVVAHSFMIQFLPLAMPVLASGPVGIAITVVTIGICFGMGAIVYYLFERNALSKLVDWMFGTPEKSMDKLLKRETKIEKKMENVKKLIDLKTENNRLIRNSSVRKQPVFQGNNPDPIQFNWRNLGQQPSVTHSFSKERTIPPFPYSREESKHVVTERQGQRIATRG